jgi:hypothetical protein
MSHASEVTHRDTHDGEEILADLFIEDEDESNDKAKPLVTSHYSWLPVISILAYGAPVLLSPVTIIDWSNL